MRIAPVQCRALSDRQVISGAGFRHIAGLCARVGGEFDEGQPVTLPRELCHSVKSAGI